MNSGLQTPDYCQYCEQIVTYIHLGLEQPSVVDYIENLVKEGCAELSSVKAEVRI